MSKWYFIVDDANDLLNYEPLTSLEECKEMIEDVCDHAAFVDGDITNADVGHFRVAEIDVDDLIHFEAYPSVRYTAQRKESYHG